LGSASVKAARRTLMKLTQEDGFNTVTRLIVAVVVKFRCRENK